MNHLAEITSTEQPRVHKREYLEILACILDITQIGVTKTHIVFKANLNFAKATQYLQQLHTAGLLTVSPDKKQLYMTTAKGLEFLDRYYELTLYLQDVSTRAQNSL